MSTTTKNTATEVASLRRRLDRIAPTPTGSALGRRLGAVLRRMTSGATNVLHIKRGERVADVLRRSMIAPT